MIPFHDIKSTLSHASGNDYGRWTCSTVQIQARGDRICATDSRRMCRIVYTQETPEIQRTVLLTRRSVEYFASTNPPRRIFVEDGIQFELAWPIREQSKKSEQKFQTFDVSYIEGSGDYPDDQRIFPDRSRQTITPIFCKTIVSGVEVIMDYVAKQGAQMNRSFLEDGLTLLRSYLVSRLGKDAYGNDETFRGMTVEVGTLNPVTDAWTFRVPSRPTDPFPGYADVLIMPITNV